MPNCVRIYPTFPAMLFRRSRQRYNSQTRQGGPGGQTGEAGFRPMAVMAPREVQRNQADTYEVIEAGPASAFGSARSKADTQAGSHLLPANCCKMASASSAVFPFW